MPAAGRRIAAIIPCLNEESSIGQVVTDLKAAVEGIVVYVYDNGSTDKTASVAREAGALTRSESRKGKGNVIRRAFADIDADIYLLIDGDGTYAADAAPVMIEALLSGPLDHVLGVRTIDTSLPSAYRPGHAWGNRMFNSLTGFLFGDPVSDMLSGYRVVSRRFVKSFPAASQEFEIETELTVHAMSLRVPQLELPVGFRDRAPGSESKLRTYRDGTKILTVVLKLTHHERPILFHNAIAGFLLALAFLLGLPLLMEFFETGFVPRLPTAVVIASLTVLAFLSVAVGVVLNGVHKSRLEAARLAYLQLGPPA